MSAAVDRRTIDDRVAVALAADPGLRQKLAANPGEVLSQIIGVSLPTGVTVHVHEESLTALHLVIPATQLVDEDLDLVSGGWPAGSCGPRPPCVT